MRRQRSWQSFLVSVLIGVASSGAALGGQRLDIQVESTIDGTPQPCYLILPEGFDPEGKPVPLVVSLHSWSAGVEQRNRSLEEATEAKGWLYVFPHFRGANDKPEACGSELARQDILDAVAWVQKRYPVDAQRIYLTGSSGGGHMTLLMCGRHPDLWAAASAWVGISNLASWHDRHRGGKYGLKLRKSCGGPPGASKKVDEEYRQRSPLTYLDRARDVPLDIAAGVHDGHTGSVPIRHSLDAFNVIARAAGAEGVTEEEITQLSRKNGRLEHPKPCDQVEDAALGRKIYLRRTAARARVTIFEGGHEQIASAAIDWLSRHRKAK